MTALAGNYSLPRIVKSTPRLHNIFRPPNLGNIALPYTLGQGSCDFRTMSKISSGVWEKTGGVREKCADTVNLFFSQLL
jgi:hypothetical protein